MTWDTTIRTFRGGGLPWTVVLLVFFAGWMAVDNPGAGWAASRAERESVQVLLPTRLAIPPLALGAMRERLEQALRRPASLLLRPASAPLSLEEISSQTLLLTENGVVPPGFPLECRPASVSFTMGWVLAAHRPVFDRVASSPPGTLEEMLGLMKRARDLAGNGERGEVAYPWFESLFFPPTLRHLDLYLQDWKGSDGREGTTGLLHHAMEAGLLNPLSVEADENLANEVFEAGDAVFSTLWFPFGPRYPAIGASQDSAVLAPSSTSHLLWAGSGVASGVVFLPFPGIRGPGAVPCVDLHLLVPVGTSIAVEIRPPRFPETIAPVVPGVGPASSAGSWPAGEQNWTWRSSEASEEATWSRLHFPILYGKLIRGEP